MTNWLKFGKNDLPNKEYYPFSIELYSGTIYQITEKEARDYFNELNDILAVMILIDEKLEDMQKQAGIYK